MVTNPREELHRVLTGETAVVSLLRLSKQSGYTLDRLKDMAREMGLYVNTTTSRDNYCASLPVKGRIATTRT